MLFLLLFVLILLLGGCLWGLVCNEKTHKQRSALIQAISTDAKARIQDGRFDHLDNYQVFDIVPYDAHMWALFFFKDPKTLYPQSVQEFL